jgi:hypothetical protein
MPKRIWLNAVMKTAEKVVQHFGSKEAAITALEINPETLRLWLRDGIPLARALFVEEKTGGAVPAESILSEARESAT